MWKSLTENRGFLYSTWLILAFLVLFFAFFQLGKPEIQDWDEAWYGTYAKEMIDSGDWLNYYRAGVQDFWNGKPPLMVWSIAISYKIFGFNAFALRFPSALAAVLLFIFLARWVRKQAGNGPALLAVALLATAEGIIGDHVGRTADTDMLFVLWMFLAFVQFHRFWAEKIPNAAIWAGFWLGLGFLTKGTAVLVFLPGILIYSLAAGGFIYALRSRAFWTGLGLFLAIVGGWIAILHFFSEPLKTNSLGVTSRLDILFGYDSFQRVLDPGFVTDNPYVINYMPPYLDTKFNLWNYAFYATLLGLLVAKIRLKKSFLLPGHLLFSLIITLSGFFFLTLLRNKNGWYAAPLLPFVGIIVSWGLHIALKWRIWVLALVLPVLGFTMVKQGMRILEDKNVGVREFFATLQPQLEAAPQILVLAAEVPPAWILYADFINPEVREVARQDCAKYPGSVAISDQNTPVPGSLIAEFNGHRCWKIH